MTIHFPCFWACGQTVLERMQLCGDCQAALRKAQQGMPGGQPIEHCTSDAERRLRHREADRRRKRLKKEAANV